MEGSSRGSEEVRLMGVEMEVEEIEECWTLWRTPETCVGSLVKKQSPLEQIIHQFK